MRPERVRVRGGAAVRAVVVAVGLGVAAAVAHADPPVPTLVVRSRPSGAEVELQGERSAVGRTPFELTRPLIGRYRLTGSAPGFERWHRTVQLGAAGTDTVWMVLAPKHRVLGVARSLLVPGWGAFYEEHPNHGWTLLAGDGVALATLGIAQKQYSDKSSVYDALVIEARGAPPGSTPARLRDAALVDRDHAYDFRNATVAVSAGWWAAGVLDALLFGPSHRTAGGPASWIEARPEAFAVSWRF